MKAFMPIVAVALATIAGTAFALGEYDGAWSCQTTVRGTVHPHLNILATRSSDQMTGYAVAAVSANQEVTGYGVGQLDGNTFSGIDQDGEHFSCSIVHNVASCTGYARVPMDSSYETVPTTTNCMRIW